MRMLLSVLLLVFSFPALAVELWGGAQSGMTIEQVEEKFPEAKRTPDSPTYIDGSSNELVAPAPNLSGQPFRVEFTFLDGKLTDVRLKLDATLSFQDVGPVVSQIRQALVLKYGAPVEWEERLTGIMPKYDGTWRGPGILITVSAMAVGDNPATIQIRYFAPANAQVL